MDTNDPKKFAATFAPAYASKVDLACELAPKFEKDVTVSKLKDPTMAFEGAPHHDMGKKFEVMEPRSDGHNLMQKTSGVPMGAIPIKMRGPEEVAAAAKEAPKTPVKPTEVLEEVVVVTKKDENADVPDAKVLERIERMMRAEQRARDLEDENRVLVRTISRLQAEIDQMRASAGK